MVKGVTRGPCGEKVGRAADVEPIEARLSDGSVLEGVRLRWLISSDDGAPTFAMRLFEVEPGAVIPGHSHPWEHEIYVLEGSVRVCIENNCYELSAGDFIYIPPNTTHSYKAGSMGVRFLCLIPNKPSVPEDWAPPCKQG